MLQDTHIHIQDLKDRSSISAFLTEARSRRITCFYGCAITPADWPSVESISRQYDGFLPFFGIHPWFSDITPSGWEEKLKALLIAYPAAGVGETGLDKTRKNIDLEEQKNIFIRHLHIARELKRPFTLHCVRAWPECIALIKEYAPKTGFIAHSFSGTQELMQDVLSLGGYLSFSSKQLLKPDEAFIGLFRQAQLDRVLIETDFPYQIKWSTPQEYVQQLESAYRSAAEIKGVVLDEFIDVVRRNGQACANQAFVR